MKIKLRDITPEQWDENKRFICPPDDEYDCLGESCPFYKVGCTDDWVNNKDMYSDKFLDQEIDIEVEPTPIKRYRKKPVVVEAIRYTGFNFDECAEFMSCPISPVSTSHGSNLIPNVPICITTLEGSMYAFVGDYIVKGVKGEFYPCKPDIFEETYEELE